MVARWQLGGPGAVIIDVRGRARATGTDAGGRAPCAR